MKIYTEPNAYDIIQRDVETGFHGIINKTPQDIKIICIVGAYYGFEISRLLHNYKNAHIYAFEAYPAHFDVLERNYKEYTRVTLFNTAVTSTVGDVEFHQLTVEGNGSILPFQGDKFGANVSIESSIRVPSTTLKEALGDIEIDLLWVDVQGAELEVLKGTDTKKCASMFLEIHTHDFIKAWDEEPYKWQCYKEDLEEYLEHHILYSIGLDNANGNGQGNSFWVKK